MQSNLRFEIRLLTTMMLAFTLHVTSGGESSAQDFQHRVIAAQKGDFPTSFAQDLRRGEEAYARGDYATALREWGSLAQHDDAAGQYNLGRMYDSGRGVTQDYRKAVKWYLKSAEQGFATAQFATGWMYYVGHGVIKDIVYAHMWANIAASKGETAAGETWEILAKEMTVTQLAEAQKLARECVKKQFKGC